MADNTGNQGITPNYIVFNKEGDLIVAGPSGGVGAPSRGKILTLGPSGTILASNGLDAIWIPYNENPGSVTSVNVTGSQGLSVTGGPITTNGTINISFASPTLLPNTGNVTGTIDLASGNFALNAPVSGGTLTSVGITSANGDMAVTGSPLTGSGGIINVDLSVQSALPSTPSVYTNPTVTVNNKGIITSIASGTINAMSIAGNLQIANFNGAANASTSTFWRGDGQWAIVVGPATPLSLGVASVGVSTFASRQDHVHAMPSATDVGALPSSGGTILGSLTVNSNLTVGGNLTVNGTLTAINSTTLEVADINIIMGNVTTPTDTTANGGGIQLLGTTTKSILWDMGNTNWTSSEYFNLLAGKTYRIDNTDVLTSTGLGTGIVSSSLTSVGTITSGTWHGTVLGVAYGGTGTNTSGATAANNIGAAALSNNLSDLQSASSARTNLGLGTAATQNTSAFLQPSLNLSDILNASTARTNLGLGTASVQNVGTFAQVASNLSDISSASSARTNLGLGTAATQNTSAFLQPSNNLSDVSNTNTALNTLLPSQTANSGKFLQTNGTTTSWVSGSSGSVTSVATGTGLTGGPITGSGTISLASITNNHLLANTSGSSSTPVDTALTTLIDNAISSTQGSILYRSSSIWNALTPSTSGYVLTTQGVNANPVWSAPYVPGGSTGNIQFASGGLFAGTGNLFWDATNHRLGVNNSSPSYALDVTGDINTTTKYRLAGSTILANPASNLNTAVGVSALNLFTSGSGNTALGYNTLAAQTSGNQNTALGYLALQSSVTDGPNTAVGGHALSSLNGSGLASGNTAVGYSSMSNISTGSSSNNTAVGSLSLQGSSGNSMQNNVAIGSQAGQSITTGSNNTLLGQQVGGINLTSGSYNILIGVSSSVDAPSGSGSINNYINIGLAMDGTSGENSNTAKAGIRTLGYYAEKNYGYVSTGTSATVANVNSTYIIDGPTAFTLTAPPAPVDGQFLRIAAGNTAITTFSFIGNSGQSVNFSPTSLASNTSIKYIYRLANTTWYKI